MSRLWYSACGLVIWAVMIGAAPSPAGAQTPAAGPQTGAGPRAGEVASDPIRCWWKADRTAVRVGERFGLVLTCAVIEAGPITVVPVLNQLEPGALSLTPFEVVGGTRADDVVAPPWRYVQFDYSVRLLSDGFFGQDVTIPGVTVTYNLQTAGGTQGRDQTYALPTLPMRILSLVPRNASDIRDASGQTFATIASRRFRSSLALVLAWVTLAFAAVLGVFAVVRVVGDLRAKKADAVRKLPVPSVLGGCLDALSEVASDASRAGWSPVLARRAVAALRIAGAVALNRPVAQDFAGPDAVEREGQVTVRTGWLRPQRVLLSASTTAKVIAGYLVAERHVRASTRVRLESIAEALTVLSAASYGRTSTTDTSALDSAVESGKDVIRGLRTSARWPMRTADAVLRSVTFGS